jgi:hypothetical protein
MTVTAQSSAHPSAAWRSLAIFSLAAFTLAASGIGDDAEAARKRKRRASQKIEKVEKPAIVETEAHVDDLLAAKPGAKLITAGKLKAIVRSLSEGRTVLAGGSAFAEVTLRKPKGSGINRAELRVSGDGGRLSIVGSGKGVKTRSDGSGLIVEIDMGRAAEQALLVEMKDVRELGGKTRSMSFVLVSASDGSPAASPTLALAFDIADCSFRFREALSGILADRAELFASGLKRAGAADERLPGSWVFNPKSAFSSTRKKKKGEESVSLPPGVATAEERRIASMAAAYVSGRGAATDFGRRGRYAWVSNRIMVDIRSYLEQSSNPALCAGVDVMADYIVSNSTYLREAVDTAAAISAKAEKAALAHLERLQSMVSSSLPSNASLAPATSTTGSFAFVGEASAASAADRGPPDTLKPLVAEVAGRIFFSGDAQSVAAMPDTLGALKRTSELLKSGAANGRTDELLAEARLTLALIEGAHYLSIGSSRHALVGNAIYGSLEAIRDARDRTCGCQP